MSGESGDGMVEKPLTLALLESGQTSLGEGEAERLAMPSYSGPIPMLFEGEPFHAEWQAATRRIAGELFSDHLQLNGTPGGILRLHRQGDQLLMEVVSRSATRAVPLWDRDPQFTIFEPRPRLRPAESPSQTPPLAKPRSTFDASQHYRLRERSEYRWHGQVGIHKDSVAEFIKNVGAGGWDDHEFFELRIEGEELAAVNDFDELMALDVSNIDHMPHQEQTALKVLRSMQGRAILADEVGLGKTIEAGLILKELVLRGMAQRVLILCPASLRDQWKDELKEKFDFDFDVAYSGRDAHNNPLQIMSIDLAARNAESLAAVGWDAVVLDEAHKVAGHAKKRQALIRSLEPRYMLFLSATPVQNDLLELYRLVDLLRPGTFRSAADFKNRFVDPYDKRRPVEPAALRSFVADVVVRTTRAQAGVDRVERKAVDIPVTLSKKERQAYDLVTTVLREEMNQPSDRLVQRHLAHRLTSSPRALATTALRVADKHPNPRVREILEPLAALCIDFGLTNRQKALLKISQKWLSERPSADESSKGKVLVFTQHTDVMDDLLRVYAEAGIQAQPFHGGLAPKAKRAAIEAFRGSIDVMVSTESGAEGLNLQFANCVINFDLPWNPMRIEQRIGRVHRVTQHRNVYVANLYAKETVDQHVYDILKDKLKMFELLFGQVTTILGELDDTDTGQTFENRIMTALVSPSDAEMNRQLTRLADQVGRAKDKADEMIEVGGHLDWAALPSVDWREELGDEDASELRPDVAIGRRQRREAAQRFARRFLEVSGARIVFDTSDEEGHAAEDNAFVTAELPDDLAEAFGRQHLHLAFSAAALANHADAQLCTVGSEFFDELLWTIRENGDLLAWMPPSDLPPGPSFRHAVDLKLDSRTVGGPQEWAAQAVWRVRDGSGSAGEQIVLTTTGDAEVMKRSGSGTSPLGDGEHLPVSLPKPRAILDQIQTEALPELRQAAETIQTDLDERAGSERARMLDYFDAQILARTTEGRGSYRPEVRTESANAIAQLKHARSAYVKAQGAKAEVRCDLLAVEIVGNPQIPVHEIWVDRHGQRHAVDYQWDAGTQKPGLFDPAGRPLKKLALCKAGHATTSADLATCPTCDLDFCTHCGPDREFRHCSLCDRSCCPTCVNGSVAVCPDCLQPERALNRDTPDGLIGWRTASGTLILVGSDMAGIVAVDGSVSWLTDRPITGWRSGAVKHHIGLCLGAGIRPDAPLLIRDPEQTHIPEAAVLPLESVSRAWWMTPAIAVRPDDETTTVTKVEAVGEYPSPDLHPLDEGRLGELIRELQHREPATEPAALTTSVETSRSWIELTSKGIVGVTQHIDWDGAVSEMRTPVKLDAASIMTGDLLRGEWNAFTVSVRRIHRSFVVTVRRGEATHTTFVPAAGDVSQRSEEEWHRWIERERLDPLSVVGLRTPVPEPTAFASPAGVRLLERRTEPVLARFDDQDFDRSPGADDLPPGESASTPSPPVSATAPDLHPHLLAASSLDLRPVVFGVVQRVHEHWHGIGEAERTYTVTQAGPAWPTLDDTGEPGNRFGVDSLGHLFETEHSWACPSCARTRCRACGPEGELAQCDFCDQPACGDCRSTGFDETIESTNCVRCAVRSCGHCARRLTLEICSCCSRALCRTCVPNGLCLTCRSLPTDGLPTDPNALPADLAAAGCGVRAVTDDDALVYVISGEERLEIAIIRDDTVERWFTLNDTPPAAAIILLALRGVGDGNMGLAVHNVERPLEPVGPRVKFEDDQTPCLRWQVDRTAGEPPTKGESVVRLRDDEQPVDGLMRSLAVPLRLPDILEPESRNALLPLTAGARRPAFTATLSIERMAFTRREYLTEAGLWRQEATTDGLRTESIPWDTADPSMSSAFESWVPRPTPIARVHGESTMATIGHLGDVAMIEVRDRSGAIWCSVLGDSSHLSEALALGIEHSDSGAPLWVSAFATPPGFPPKPVVGNGTCTIRNVTTVMEESSVAASPEVTAAAAHIFATSGQQHVRVPELDSRMTGEMATAFRAAAASLSGGLPKAQVVTVVLHVNEVWATPCGEVTVDYDVDPRRAFEGIATVDSPTRVPVGYACRSRHVASRLDRCPYCQTDTCVGCPDGVKPCTLCDFPVCSGCAQVASGVPHLCAACGSLKKVGWYGRRKLVDAEFRNARGVVGSDAFHDVALAVDNNLVRITVRLPGSQPRVWTVAPNWAFTKRINEAYGKALLFSQP